MNSPHTMAKMIEYVVLAEFDIDKGAQTDLALELHEYDTSPSADYESWMLLEPEPSAVPAPAPAASTYADE